MRISVAMAARDAERFLEPLLDSLAAQTRPPHELVVYDDASTDSTPALLDRFARCAPFPVRVERHEEHAGHVTGFFRAASLCEGEAIALCDADDVWRPEKLEVCGRELERSGALLTLHAARVVDAGLGDLGHDWPAIDATRTVEPLCLTGLERVAPGMAMVFRRTLLEAVDPAVRPRSRYHDGPMLHDEWVFFLAGALGRVRLVARSLVLYRQHEANDSGGWFSERRHRRLNPASENYRTIAELTREWSEFFIAAADDAPAHADRLLAAARHYRRAADQWALRVALYETRERRRRARIVGMLHSGDAYRPRDAGGFGRAALGKDLVAGVLLRTGG